MLSSIACPDGSAHSDLASFPGPAQLFFICRVWRCGVKILNAHCLGPHVAAVALQTPKALHTHSSIFSVEDLVQSYKLEWPARNSHARNPHSEKPNALHMYVCTSPE